MLLAALDRGTWPKCHHYNMIRAWKWHCLLIFSLSSLLARLLWSVFDLFISALSQESFLSLWNHQSVSSWKSIRFLKANFWLRKVIFALIIVNSLFNHLIQSYSIFYKSKLSSRRIFFKFFREVNWNDWKLCFHGNPWKPYGIQVHDCKNDRTY